MKMNYSRILASTFLLFTLLSCAKEDKDDNQNNKKPNEEPKPIVEEFPCNGSESLCGKKYDEVVYVTTHNAFNYQSGGSVNYLFPNQQFPLTRQLNDGVRGLMLDVYELNGQVVVYHGFSWTGWEPLSNNLNEIKAFLDNNPHEVLTLILECYVSSDKIESALAQAGLMDYLFTYNQDKGWPVLRDMIKNNERLVILSDKNDANGRDWYHFVWEYAVETPFSNNSLSDFTCTYNRGNPENSLFILNHFATNSGVGTGSLSLSQQANANPFLINRINQCQNALNRKINFLTVDFYAVGDVFEVANELNK